MRLSLFQSLKDGKTLLQKYYIVGLIKYWNLSRWVVSVNRPNFSVFYSFVRKQSISSCID